MFDILGKKYLVVSVAEIPELKGDGGILSFSRSEISVNINDTYTMEFALHVKPPAMLYLNGKPVTKNVLYVPVRLADWYTYGIIFTEISYKFANDKEGELMMIRSLNACVAKCIAVM